VRVIPVGIHSVAKGNVPSVVVAGRARVKVSGCTRLEV
jgi:hypothetical protein